MSKYIRHLGTIDRSLIKNEIVDMASDDVEQTIASGKFDLLKVYVELKRYETYLYAVIQKLKSTALEIAKKENKTTFQYNNAKIRIYERTKWDYSIDQEWSQIDEEIKRLSSLKKKREVLLKQSNANNKLIDKDSGEIIDSFELPFIAEKGISITLSL